MTNEEKKQLLILNMKRCLELMEALDFKFTKETWRDKGNAELKSKLREVRRDSVELERIMYPKFEHIYR